MKLLTIIGARPQFIKAATVSRIIRNRRDVTEKIIHTGQHYDKNMSEIFFKQLDIPEPDYNLEVGSGLHGEQTALMLSRTEQVLLKEKPDWVLVYGDTNSTVAGALAAAKLHIPVAHVEAGLRSFNRTMPEEINRIATDHLSDRLYAPTDTAMMHLKEEGLWEKSINVGDVMNDSVRFFSERIKRDPEGLVIPGLPERFHLVTIHRPDNTDNKINLESIFNAFASVKKSFVIPLHPRTKKYIADVITLPENVMVLEPVGYLEMLKLVIGAEKIFTDSGGLQKETYILGKPCITLRNETEWVETLHDNWNVLTGADKDKICEAEALPFPLKSQKDVFGDGNAARKIIDDLLDWKRIT